jgi:hypothetical protein
MKKRAIFSYCNFQIEKNIAVEQKRVIEKLNTLPNCKYEYLFYNKPDGEVCPDHVINYAFNKLFYEDNYDTILMLDIDCIPLNTRALEYTFDRAESGVYIGNAQRANYLQNNQHIYPAPSGMAISKEMFERIGKPSFSVTRRGDIGEELCYRCEELGIEIELYMPGGYEEPAYTYNEQREVWPLKDGQPKYAIGTTFVDAQNNEMFYHLFQCRLHVFNHHFYAKCKSIL